jgi:hypothetical protein
MWQPGSSRRSRIGIEGAARDFDTRIRSSISLTKGLTLDAGMTYTASFRWEGVIHVQYLRL